MGSGWSLMQWQERRSDSWMDCLLRIDAALWEWSPWTQACVSRPLPVLVGLSSLLWVSRLAVQDGPTSGGGRERSTAVPQGYLGLCDEAYTRAQ